MFLRMKLPSQLTYGLLVSTRAFNPVRNGSTPQTPSSMLRRSEIIVMRLEINSTLNLGLGAYFLFARGGWSLLLLARGSPDLNAIEAYGASCARSWKRMRPQSQRAGGLF